MSNENCRTNDLSKNQKGGWGCGSRGRVIISKHMALNSNHSTKKKSRGTGDVSQW
jgi:hypothetical protein